jgi:tRNA pseudouridine55 synthase
MNKQHHSGTCIFNKKIGETPLQALDRLRKEKPFLKKEKLSYAGRLDPMAEGKLLVLIGEENKNRAKYLNLDKEYCIEVLLGIGTDTHDILGIISSKNFEQLTLPISQKKIKNILKKYKKIFKQSYPIYSSKTIKGKPLFQWAREGRISEIKIPTKKVEIYDLQLIHISTISSKRLQKTLINNINRVVGDFRQKEIIKTWNSHFVKHPNASYPILKLRIRCSSGTYMRSLAYNLGKDLKLPALALSIKREKLFYPQF